MKFNENYRIENFDFFEQLKNLYLDINISGSEEGESLNFQDALNVYQLLDEAIPLLVSSYDGSSESLDKCFEDGRVKKLIGAIKNVKIFPDTDLYKINQNYFYNRLFAKIKKRSTFCLFFIQIKKSCSTIMST